MLDTIWKRNLLFVWISQMLAMAGFGMCMPFIPIFMREVLKVEEGSRGFFVSAFAFAGLTSLCIGTAFWGMISDRFGRKLMLLRANYGAAILFPLLGFAPDVYSLIAIRFLCSFFSGTANPARTLLVSNTPEEKHGYVLGILSTATTSGHMVGYFFGGLIVEFAGYKAAFLSCGALYIISGLLVQFFVKENFSVSEAKKKVKKKLSSFRQIASPVIIGLMILFFIMGMYGRLTQPFAAMLVEFVNGQENAAFWTGMISLSAAAGGLISGCFFGWISEKFSHLKILLFAVGITALATCFLPFTGNIYLLITVRFLAGLLGGGIHPLLLMWLSRSTDAELKGTYFGWSGSIHQTGGIVSTLLGGAVVLYGGICGIYIAGAFLTLLMVPFIFYTLKRDPRKSL